MSKQTGYKPRLAKINYKIDDLEAYEERTTATDTGQLVKNLMLRGAEYIKVTFPPNKEVNVNELIETTSTEGASNIENAPATTE